LNLDEALARYVSERPRFAKAAIDVKAHLEAVAGAAGIAASVHAREKDPASYRAKVVHKGYDDAWGEVTDKAGAGHRIDPFRRRLVRRSPPLVRVAHRR
jgi:hypothetical protein